MKKILVSDMEEAIAKAKRLFATDSGVDLVVVEGEATVGGVMFDARGRALLLHRSGQGVWAHGNLDLAIGKFLAAINE